MQILAITGNQLRRARELADLSQERLAARAGLSRQTIYAYELAKDEPAARTKLADAVRVHVCDGGHNRLKRYVADLGLPPPTPRGTVPRFTPTGPIGACYWEINLDRRFPVPDDQPCETRVTEPTKAQLQEAAEFRKTWFWGINLNGHT